MNSVTHSKPEPTAQDRRIASIIVGALAALAVAFVGYALITSESKTQRCDRLVNEWASLVVEQRAQPGGSARYRELAGEIGDRVAAGSDCGRSGLIGYARSGK